MAKKITEWVTDNGTRFDTEQKAKDYELYQSKLALIKPLIEVELPGLTSIHREKIARFIVNSGKALLEIMASDEIFTGEPPGQLGAGAGAQPGMFGAKGSDPCGPMPDEQPDGRSQGHPSAERGE